ncbi:copper amine oxidase N-terminal domain-containing protein [Gorillibacterium timonense]|uniref:copper amine oxidase N-terminal domain-containing protein n=1 Tax=Gorillibacterium timonense TaxID=1689269 RepID=UPI00071E1C23|nr:copper amine oxidase N-terminal domain-containing protein [Gorillibacterium timonense]
MKKFMLGLLCGALLASSTVAFAASPLQARLFPAGFTINGKEVQLDKAYKVLEADGHTYVPVRFVAENLGATVGYEADSHRVYIQNGPLTVGDPNFPGVSVGNLILTRSGKNTSVIGQLQYAGVGNTKNSLEASLTFYNAANKKLGSAILKGSFGVDTQTFTTTAAGDLRGYQTVILQVTSENGKSVTPASTLLYENKEYGFALALPAAAWKDKFTVEKEVDPETQLVTLGFIDKANQQTGGVVFRIQIYPKKLWNESGKSILEIVPSWQIGETQDRVYAMIAASDVQYNLQDEALASEYEAMRRSMERIRVSFAALQ